MEDERVNLAPLSVQYCLSKTMTSETLSEIRQHSWGCVRRAISPASLRYVLLAAQGPQLFVPS